MKKTILLTAVILLSAAGLAQAQEGQLSGTLDFTYLSSYIWRGFDYYADDHSAIQPSITLDLYGTGLGLQVLGTRAVGSGFESSENMNVTLYYSDSLNEGQTNKIAYTVGWVYYGFPDEPRSGGLGGADMQELFASVSWPEICPAGFVPSYTILTMWPSEGDSQAHNNHGWAHVLGLGYDLAVAGLTPDVPEQILHLSAQVVYNDGVAPGVIVGSASGTVDHDWSHAVLGVSTDFEISNDLTFTPAFYYQASWEDTVNTEDETWISLSMKYKF